VQAAQPIFAAQDDEKLKEPLADIVKRISKVIEDFGNFTKYVLIYRALSPMPSQPYVFAIYCLPFMKISPSAHLNSINTRILTLSRSMYYKKSNAKTKITHLLRANDHKGKLEGFKTEFALVKEELKTYLEICHIKISGKISDKVDEASTKLDMILARLGPGGGM
jgi:hypothetical protein